MNTAETIKQRADKIGAASASVPTDTGSSTRTASVVEALPFTGFVWGAGIECSFLPHLNVNQFQWTQHDRYWREDLRLAKEELGITHMRYALPWHVLEPERGRAVEEADTAHDSGEVARAEQLRLVG